MKNLLIKLATHAWIIPCIGSLLLPSPLSSTLLICTAPMVCIGILLYDITEGDSL
jgi:hypothetical protein